MVYALLRTGEPGDAARDWVVRAALTALALVQLRETNIALVAAAAASVPLAVALVPMPDAAAQEIRWRRSVATAAAFVAVPVAAFLLWRLHLAAQGITPDMAPRPLAQWSWSAPGAVLRALVTERLANNPLAGGAALSPGDSPARLALQTSPHSGIAAKLRHAISCAKTGHKPRRRAMELSTLLLGAAIAALPVASAGLLAAMVLLERQEQPAPAAARATATARKRGARGRRRCA